MLLTQVRTSTQKGAEESRSRNWRNRWRGRAKSYKNAQNLNTTSRAEDKEEEEEDTTKQKLAEGIRK